MKTIAIVLTGLFLSLSSSADAAIQKPGAFAPSVCGTQSFRGNPFLDISQICFGEIGAKAGEVGEAAVSFRFNDNQIRIYRIVERTGFRIANFGDKSTLLFQLESRDGERAAMKVVLNSAGKIESASGALGEINYMISEFHPIFVIQGER